MNGWLLDTNVVAELGSERGSVRVMSWAAQIAETQTFISVLTLGEYARGLANLPLESGYRGQLQAFIAGVERRFSGRTLSVADRVVRRWGRISGELLRTARRDPPVIDTLLAATALEHDLYLVTRNVRDVAGTGVAVFNPWDDDPALFPLKSRRM